MEGKRPVFRITVKELILEFEGDELAQRAQDSLSVLFGQAGAPALASGAEDGPKRRGRKPKAAAQESATKKTRKRRPRTDAATAQIRRLRDEGYFEQPRRASEVKATLSEAGYDLENRQIYATLKYMADKDILYRTDTGDDGVWMYSANPGP
jgi:hypothetical protein